MEKWEKSNRINLTVIKRAIPEAFRGTMFDQVDTAKAFLEDLEKRFTKNEKAETSTILVKLISMRTIGPFELISQCVQEEDRLKQERTPSAHLASTTKDKRKDNKRKKKKEATKIAPQKKQHKEPTQDGCFFCGAVGHKKK
ncbi:hypothetical protein GH714_036628 [Hevea brasiliensis]|uniref:Uncharacterized protein n=1 Tax=Hevea brasiliensis TaxID=3981 RepID=A0A6A6KKJ7_HEVBR|nr:hypothetical protein GH714_036628 [Hevea brasiliensis]